MGLMSRAAGLLSSVFGLRPSGAVRAVSTAVPLATRVWQDLTPEQAEGAMIAAQQGLTRLACDFCDQLLTDDRVAGLLDTRILGMLGLESYFEGPKLPEFWSLAAESELAGVMRWGLLLGAGFAHIEADGTLTHWHSRNFDYNRVEHKWYVTTSEGRECVTDNPYEWLVFTPYGKVDAALLGLWVSLILPELVKVYSLHDRAKASEVFGSAMIVGTASEGATQGQRDKWLSDLKNLARTARVVLPESDYKLELLEAQGQTWGIYAQSIEWADNAITIRIAGQLVTTQGTTGFARGDVHEKIAQSLLRFGEQALSTCLATSYIPVVWGVKSVVRWRTAGPDELIGEGTALKAFADGATAMNVLLQPQGQEIDLNAYCQRHGIKTRPANDNAPALPAAPVQLARLVASVPEMLGRETYQSTAIPDKPPSAFRIFKWGANVTDYGTRYFTAESAKSIMRANGNRDVMIDLEHLSLNTDARNYDPDARGWARLQVRKSGLWAVNVRWNGDGRSRIELRKQRGISPVAVFRKKDGVIIALHNLALTAMPATHDGVILIAASRGNEDNMAGLRKMLGLPDDATIQDILKALGLDDSASAEDTINAIAKAYEAGDGGADDAPPADDSATEADDAPPPSEKQEAASKQPKATAGAKLPASSKAAVTDDVTSRLNRLENGERDRLIASAQLMPREKKLLASASLDEVREYIASAPAVARKVAGVVKGEGTDVVIASGSIDAVAKATGYSAKEVASYAQKGAAK